MEDKEIVDGRRKNDAEMGVTSRVIRNLSVSEGRRRRPRGSSSGDGGSRRCSVRIARPEAAAAAPSPIAGSRPARAVSPIHRALTLSFFGSSRPATCHTARVHTLHNTPSETPPRNRIGLLHVMLLEKMKKTR